MTGNASPFQPEPDGADKAYFERQQAIMRLMASRRGQDN